MDRAEITRQLKERAGELGFSLSGVCPAAAPTGGDRFDQWLASGYAGQMHYLADRRDAYHHPAHVLDGARSILMLAMNYRTAEPAATLPGQGRVSRYAWGATDYHDLIRERLQSLADFLREHLPNATVRGVVDTAPLLEREFAQLAGLGWIGKNTLLLNREEGSWFFLAALLTDAQLAYDQPQAADHCGTCRACLDACPTDAFPQPYLLDASRCISYLTIELREAVPGELRPGMGDWVFGCDVCQDVCPWNRRPRKGEAPAGHWEGEAPAEPSKSSARHGHHGDEHGFSTAASPSRAEAEFAPLPENNPLELAALFDLDDAAFRARFRHTPLWRPRRRGLLRNAAIALGNRPTPEALPALVKGLQDDEPLVRGACAWALARYPQPAALDALRRRCAIESDAHVQTELGAALARPA